MGGDENPILGGVPNVAGSIPGTHPHERPVQRGKLYSVRVKGSTTHDDVTRQLDLLVEDSLHFFLRVSHDTVDLQWTQEK